MPHDLRLALRGLIRAPIASGLAIVCLALGIGTNATMFSVLSTTVLSAGHRTRRSRCSPPARWRRFDARASGRTSSSARA